MKYSPQAWGTCRFESQCLERSGQVVIRAGDEVRRELWVHLEVGMADPVHPDHPYVVVLVEHQQAPDGGHAHEEDDREHEYRHRYECRAEAIRLRDQGEGDHRAGEDGEEHAHAAERLLVGQGARREEAPVLGGQDLERFRLRPQRRDLS